MQASKTSPLYITRFVAAYLVLVYHYGPPALLNSLKSARHFAEAVNYFFFISGFVMILSNKKHFIFNKQVLNFSKGDFWLRRIARIYPLYVLALLLLVAFNYGISEIDPSIPKRVWLELLGVQRWLYAGAINYPDWTVSCEFFFYFLFPFTLPLLITRPLRQLALLTVGFFVFNLLFSYYFARYTPQLLARHPSHAVKLLVDSISMHPFFKYSIFLFGCLCGRYYLEARAGMAVMQRYSLPITLACAVVIWAFFKYDVVAPVLMDAGILGFVYFPFILALCSLSDHVSGLLSNSFFVFLGEISYGMYIMQAPVENFYEYLFFHNKRFGETWHFLVYTLFLIGVCTLLYYSFEMPMRNVILRRANLRTKPGTLTVAP